MTTENLRSLERVEGHTKSGKRIVRGQGRLSRITFGIGNPRLNVTKVVGASMESIDWNCPPSDK